MPEDAAYYRKLALQRCDDSPEKDRYTPAQWLQKGVLKNTAEVYSCESRLPKDSDELTCNDLRNIWSHANEEAAETQPRLEEASPAAGYIWSLSALLCRLELNCCNENQTASSSEEIDTCHVVNWRNGHPAVGMAPNRAIVDRPIFI